MLQKIILTLIAIPFFAFSQCPIKYDSCEIAQIVFIEYMDSIEMMNDCIFQEDYIYQKGYSQACLNIFNKIIDD